MSVVHLCQLPQDLVVAPSAAWLEKCDLTASQDILEVCIWGVAEHAAFLTPKPLMKALRTGMYVICWVDEAAEPCLQDLPKKAPQHGPDHIAHHHVHYQHLLHLIVVGLGPEPWRFFPPKACSSCLNSADDLLMLQTTDGLINSTFGLSKSLCSCSLHSGQWTLQLNNEPGPFLLIAQIDGLERQLEGVPSKEARFGEAPWQPQPLSDKWVGFSFIFLMLHERISLWPYHSPVE